MNGLTELIWISSSTDGIMGKISNLIKLSNIITDNINNVSVMNMRVSVKRNRNAHVTVIWS